MIIDLAVFDAIGGRGTRIAAWEGREVEGAIEAPSDKIVGQAGRA